MNQTASTVWKLLLHALSLIVICAMLTIQFGSAAQARFISPDDYDPTLPGVGTNRYAYAGNDPVNKSDPNGHIWGFVGALIGALLGGTTQANTPGRTDTPKSKSDGQQLAGMVAGVAGATVVGKIGGAVLDGYSKKKDKDQDAKNGDVEEQAALQSDKVPGRVQSRINLESDAWNHVVERHFDPTKNSSQFSVTKQELRSLLQDKTVVGSPITKVTENGSFVRTVDVGKVIGTNKFNNFAPTSTLTVVTDRAGNLLSAFPGVLQ